MDEHHPDVTADRLTDERASDRADRSPGLVLGRTAPAATPTPTSNTMMCRRMIVEGASRVPHDGVVGEGQPR